jgi:hypothetical protein
LIAHGVEIPAALRSLGVLMVLGPLLGAMIFIGGNQVPLWVFVGLVLAVLLLLKLPSKTG